MSIFELAAAFLLGGCAYGALELCWRGRTHWTMLPLGGACFAFMYLAAASSLAPAARYLLCAAFITAAEFCTGALVNVRLGWGVWDYSGERLNLYGQICARYALLWLIVSVPGCALAGLLRRSLRLLL